jgi:hypothetical protein
MPKLRVGMPPRRFNVVGTAYPTFLAIVLLSLVVGGQGCSEPIATAPEPLVVQVEADQVWGACQAELKKRGFRLDRVDRRSGIIETYPLTSKQWFEFWCQDVVTDYDLAESILHTIRRRVTMAVTGEPEDQYRLQCRVAVERLSASPELTSGQVRVRDIFGQSAGRIPTPSVSETRKKRQPQWLPIGQDHALETDILQSLDRALNRESQG